MDDRADRPRITALEDGPLRYERRVAEEGPVGEIIDARGESPDCEYDVLLCRCGESSRKPFCDFSHARVGFESRKRTSGRLDYRTDYEGEGVTVHDNRQMCAHVEFCVDELPEVFDRKAQPWIDPDGASAERVAAQVERCPSGALSYSVDGVEHRDRDREPKVWAQPDGPYFVEGWIEIAGEPRDEEHSEEHCTLCRCGASRNKPFCDGKHWKAGFEDPGPGPAAEEDRT